MRIRPTTLTLAVTALLFVTDASLAGDAADAVELLRQSFKCAKKIEPSGQHVIYAYIGSEGMFSLSMNISYVSNGVRNYSSTYTADFDKLASAPLSPSAPDTIGLNCKESLKCIQITLMGGLIGYWSQISNRPCLMPTAGHCGFTLCDAETAANAKLAIDTLIRLNSK
jgi:hypothetical protein